MSLGPEIEFLTKFGHFLLFSDKISYFIACFISDSSNHIFQTDLHFQAV